MSGDVLGRILARKHQELEEAAARLPLRELSRRAEGAPAPRGFGAALARRVEAGGPAVIAELKRASPSKGLLRRAYDPEAIARAYEAAGAACLSVLTDRDFFQGDPEHLRRARSACALPVLRKDFLVDPYQVYEARVWGADAVLLIVAALGDPLLRELGALALELGLDLLVEVHDEAELERALALREALAAPPERCLLGVNNRDLHSFETRLDTTLALRERVPDERWLVSESGIHAPQDVARLRAAGVHAFLVGESFMRAPDPGAALRGLFFPGGGA